MHCFIITLFFFLNLHFNSDLTPADINTREAAVKVAENLGIPVKEADRTRS
jgi:hypothetical protein